MARVSSMSTIFSRRICWLCCLCVKEREGVGRGEGEGGSGDDDGYVDTAQYMQPYMSAVVQFVQPIKLRQVFLHGQNVNQSHPPQTGECMHVFIHIHNYESRADCRPWQSGVCSP